MAKEKEPERTNYGISQRNFIICWESSEYADEVYDKLKAISDKLNLPPMPKEIIMSRASDYRTSGINLKKMKRRGTRNLDVSGMNELIEQIKAGMTVEVEVDEKPAAAPPKKPSKTKVLGTVKKLLEDMDGAAKVKR